MTQTSSLWRIKSVLTVLRILKRFWRRMRRASTPPPISRIIQLTTHNKKFDECVSSEVVTIRGAVNSRKNAKMQKTTMKNLQLLHPNNNKLTTTICRSDLAALRKLTCAFNQIIKITNISNMNIVHHYITTTTKNKIMKNNRMKITSHRRRWGAIW